MRLNRGQCIGLMETVSKSGIDFFELRSGCVKLQFDRLKRDRLSDGHCPHESALSEVEVLAPVLGICRTAPRDDAPPYVQAGQVVSEQDIVCSIDVVEKRFDVLAGTRGRIIQLNARSGELVEYKQRLAVIRTAG